MKMHLAHRLLAVALSLVMLVGMLPTALAYDDGGTRLNYRQVSNDAVCSTRENQMTGAMQSSSLYADTDEVRVSIVLEDAAPISMFSMDAMGVENFASDPQVQAYRSSLLDQQEQVENAISRYALDGRPLDVVWNLTLASNMISANVPYGRIDAIRQIPGVEHVHLETRHELDVYSKGGQLTPNMAISTDMVGASAPWNAGYTGAGMRVAIIDTGIDLAHQSFDSSAYLHSMEELAQAEGKSLDAYLDAVDVLDAAEVASVASQLHAVQIYGENEENTSALDPSALYVNEKVPFVFNYIDMDLNGSHEKDEQSEHGSHVAGIAAANKYIPQGDGFAKALDTVYVQGNAPDAQLIVMKVFGVNGAPYESDYMAAIEDAIVLGCDVVNMSLGSPAAGMTIAEPELQAALDELGKTDMVVAVSAGNAGSYFDHSLNGLPYPYAGEIQYHTGGSPGTYTNSLCVASVDNDGSISYKLKVGDALYDFTESTGKNVKPITTLDTSTDGSGTDLDFVLIDGTKPSLGYGATTDLTGKVVICSRGETSFGEKADMANENGAAALIIHNNQPGFIRMDLADYEGEMPAVSISQADAEAIKASAEKHPGGFFSPTYYTGKITISNSIAPNMIEREYKSMSNFSSWGVPGDLSMKPEITAPGGSIYSVNGLHGENGQILGGHQDYELMSGTSMAAPQIAGITALVKQYIESAGLHQPGLTDRALAQSLMMSTATPLLESAGNYYPILRQGAGLVNAAAATSADSYILVDGMPDGKVKVELLDDPQRTGVYHFGFTIHNMDGKDHSYDLSASVFTQKISKINEVENAYCMDNVTMPVPAVTTFTVNGMAANAVTVPGSGSAHVEATMVLDQAEMQNILRYFTNGFYVQAFVRIDAQAPTAEGVQSTSHSIPVLGFCGNWTDPSMFDYGSFPYYRSGELELPPHMMEANEGEEGLYKNNVLSIVYHDREGSYYYGGNPFVADTEYIPERNAFNSEVGDEIFGWIYSVTRNAAAGIMKVSPVEGSTPFKPVAVEVSPESLTAGFYHPSIDGWVGPYFLEPLLWHGEDGDDNPLPENTMVNISITLAPELYVNESGSIRWNDLGKGATLSTLVTIDNTAPQMTSDPVLNGNTLTISAQDNQYIASAAIYDATGTRALTYSNPNQKEQGVEVDVELDLDGIVGKKFYVQVMDYAANAATYEVYYESEFQPDVTSYYNVFNEMDQTWYGCDTDANYAPISYAAQNIVAAERVDDMVFAFDNYQNYGKMANFYVMPADDPGDVTKVSTFYAPDEEYRFNVGDMAYNYIDHTMYLLYYIQDETLDLPYLATVDLSTGYVETLGRMPIKAKGLAIDLDGTFYTIGVESRDEIIDTGFFPITVSTHNYMLYTFTPDAMDAPVKISDTPCVADVKGELSWWKVSLSWDPYRSTVVMADSQAMYMSLVGIYQGKQVAIREIDPATAETTTIKAFNVQEGEGQEKVVLNSLFMNKPIYDFDKPQAADHANAQALLDYVTGVRSDISSEDLKDVNGDGRVDTYDVHLLLRIQDNPTVDDFGTTDIPTGVFLSYENKTMIIGTSSHLDFAVVPWNLSDRSVTWSSSDDSIVSVDQEGNLTANALGTCTIYAASQLDPTVYGACVVTVDNIHADMLGLADGQWVSFDTGIPGQLSESLGSTTAPLYAAANGNGMVYAASYEVTEAGPVSKLYTVDPVTRQETLVGPIAEADGEAMFVNGLAYAPNVHLKTLAKPADGALVGLCHNLVLFIDPTNAQVVQVMDYGLDTNVFVGIANSGSLLDSTYNIHLDEFLLIDTNGNMYRTAYGTTEGDLGWYQENVNDTGALVGETGYSVGENVMNNSLSYAPSRTGGRYLFWNCFDGASHSLIAIDFDQTGNVYHEGDFPQGVNVTAMLPGSAFPAPEEPQVTNEVLMTVSGAQLMGDLDGFHAITDPAMVADYGMAPTGNLFGLPVDVSEGTPVALPAEPAADEAPAKAAPFVIRNVEADKKASTVSLDLVPVENTTNGLVTFTYDDSILRFDGAYSPYLNSVNDRASGSLVLGFAAKDAVSAEAPVLHLSFDVLRHAERTMVDAFTAESGKNPVNQSDAMEVITPAEDLPEYIPVYPVHPPKPVNPVNPQPPKPVEPEKPAEPEKPEEILDVTTFFTDVPADAWYRSDVSQVVKHGLMSGVADTQFAPNDQLTRSMMVTILHRAANSPATAASNAFSDVAAGSWYSEAVAWASSNSIVNGTSDTTFSPNMKISRQEFVTMLWRYAKAMGYDVSAQNVTLPDFVDRSEIAPWAGEAVSWAYANGILSGKDGNHLDPQGSATRAEAAAMLNRFTKLSPKTQQN